jgi:hypothetical protein
MIKIIDMNKDINKQIKEKGGKEDPSKWNIISIDENGEETTVHEMDLIKVSLSSKYNVVSELIDELNELMPDDFGEWFDALINVYIEQDYNSELLLEQADTFLYIASEYLKQKNIDYSKYVNRKKKSKTSVFFDEEDMEAIAISSTCLKLYSIFWYDSKLKLTDNVHKLVYEKFLSPCIESDTTTKIYQIIRSRTNRSSLTDKYMWEFIKLTLVETPESYTMLVFNYLMNSLFSSIDITQNPIPFIVSVIDESINWMMCSVYNNKILYGDVFGNAEEIYGSDFSSDSLYIYCCNDVVGKAAKTAMTIIENEYEINEEQITEIGERLDNITMLHPHMKRITLPIATEVLEIPYKYLTSSPPKHLILLGFLMYHCSQGNLADKFPVITEFLRSIPRNNGVITSRSSYRIKALEYLIKNDEEDPNIRTFGFKSNKLKYDIISCNCGILSASRKNLCDLLTGNSITKFNYFELENDTIEFYGKFYSKQLDTYFNQMRTKIDSYLE